jgi:hypothetical protein
MSDSVSPNELERWFLPDEPVQDDAHDEFSHADVARNLHEMVKEKGAPPIIGLLGPFGVGKSSVVELLSAQLKGNRDLAVIRVSAERHSEPTGLHRTLLYAVGEALQCTDPPLRERKDIAKILKAVEQSSELATSRFSDIPLLKMIKTSPRATWRAAILCLAVMALWIGLVMVGADIWLHHHFLHAFSSGIAVPLALLFGLAAGLAKLLGSTSVLSPLQAALLTPDKVTELTPRAEVADEFERVFAELVKIDGKRLVVAVDDVDRLAPERVLETLHVIHSFQRACQQPRPTFIVSCDERIVRDAIAVARPGLSAQANDLEAAATAFLDRMFLQRQYVPPHPARDMRGYARDLLTSTKHTGATRLRNDLGSVVEVLIHDGVVDPRHTIRLLNSFFGDYRLALMRESGTSRRALKAGEVTKFPLVLARLTVLKVDFPDAYAEIVNDADLLDALDSLVRDQKRTEHQDELLRIFFSLSDDLEVPNPREVAGDIELPTSESSLLLRYISRTRDFVDKVDSLLPFLYLGQDQIDRSLGSGEARRVRDMLANAQIELLRGYVQSIANRTEVGSERDIDSLVELIGELLSSLTGVERVNAQNAICQVIGEIPARLRGGLADRIGKFAEDDMFQISVGDAITAAVASTDVGSREALFGRVLMVSVDPFYLNEMATLAYERSGELIGAGYPRTDIDDYVKGAISEAAKAASLPLLHTWLMLVSTTDSHEATPAPIQGLVAFSYLQAAVAQPADSPSLDDDDVQKVGRLFQADEASRGNYAVSAVKLINAHGLGESFGRLALSSAIAAGEVTDKSAADLVNAISRKTLGDGGTFETTIEPRSVRELIALLVQWCPRVQAYTTKLVEDEKAPLLNVVVPVCTAIISEANQLSAHESKMSDDLQLTIGEIRDLGCQLFSVLVTNQPDAVGPCVAALTAQWQARRGVEADAFLWVEPTLAVIDKLDPPTGDLAVAGIVDGVIGRTRSDAVATSSLPVLEKALSTDAGARAVPGLVASLRVQLTSGNPDAALFAMDVIGLVYRSAPDPAAADAPNVVNALNTLIAPRTAPTLSEALRCLTGTKWPSAVLATIVNTASQYSADMDGANLDDLLGVLERAREAGVSIPELSIEMSNRLIDQAVVRGDVDSASVGALWQVCSAPARARLAVAVGGVGEAAKVTLETNEVERPAEVDRWLLEIVGSVEAGTSTAGVKDFTAAVLKYPDVAYGAVLALTNEWLSGTTVVPVAAWPLLFSVLSSEGMIQEGQRLYSSLLEGKDQALRALPLLAAWCESAPSKSFDSVITADAFGEFVRDWVIEHQDVEVASAIRPFLAVSPERFARAILDRVGRRPRGDARPAWEAVFSSAED